MESMGVASGCDCKEVYRFPHITYPYSSCIHFLQQHPYFLFIKKNVFHINIYRQARSSSEAECIYWYIYIYYYTNTLMHIDIMV